MKDWRPTVQLKTISGTPVFAGSATIVPQSQALIVRLPFYRFVYHRPLAVLVEQDGQTRRLPVVDVTRLALIGLALLTLIIPVFAISNRPGRR